MCQESEGQFGRPITEEDIEGLRHKIGGAEPGAPSVDLRLIAATMWLLEEGQITRGPAHRIVARLTKPATPSGRARDPAA